jgi:cytochrome c2
MKIRRPFAQTLGLAWLWLTGCNGSGQIELQRLSQLTGGGDARVGRQDIRDKGCIACHSLSSVAGARGLVGPPLDGIADRSSLAGELSNTPDHMILWIEHPHQVEPNTVMPEMGLSEQDSRDIAAFLYTQHSPD